MDLATVKNFKPISLDGMEKVKLMKRTDKKFMVPLKLLPNIFSLIKENYYMLEINNERFMNYHTVYFDTPDDKLYILHHNGKLNRYKIRKRIYLETNTCFLEIKFKNNKGKTIKERIKGDSNMYELTQREKEFLISKVPFNANTLFPKISNNFIRMTLAHNEFNERCTIDLNIDFLSNDHSMSIENLVIIEIKQNGRNNNSPLIKALAKFRIKPVGFSKYCMGRALTDPEIKQNAFKPKLRAITKVTSK